MTVKISQIRAAVKLIKERYPNYLEVKGLHLSTTKAKIKFWNLTKAPDFKLIELTEEEFAEKYNQHMNLVDLKATLNQKEE